MDFKQFYHNLIPPPIKPRMLGITVTLLLATLLFLTLPVAADVIEVGNFDYDNHGWTLLDNGGGRIVHDQSDEAFQAQGLFMNGSGPHTLSRAIDTTGFTTIQVLYWTNGQGLEEADTFQAQWSDDGGQTWTTFQRLSGDEYGRDWVLQDFMLEGGENNPNFALRFQFDGDSGNDQWFIDEIMVLGDGEVLAVGDFGESLGGWTAVDGGGGNIQLDIRAHHDFQMRIEGWGAHQLFKQINTTGLLNIRLSYYVRGIGLESADTFRAEWSPNGGVSWILLQTLDGTSFEGSPVNVWRPFSFSLPAAAADNPNLMVRFVFDADSSSDLWFIDQVQVDGDFRSVRNVTLTSNSPVTVGEPTTLMAQVVGEAISFEWDFGDGSAVETTEIPIIEHIYPNAGDFNATVTVFATLNSQSASTVVNITDTPISTVTVSYNGPVEVGQEAIFAARVDSGTGVQFIWDFGDGSPAVPAGPVVSHVFDIPDVYTVTVLAFNTESNLSSHIHAVVNPATIPELNNKVYLPIIFNNTTGILGR
ncbi:MAG: PKD domain-containing protein [Anaerolineae bacterium]|nr:PKD domain-containing protein [Anaerolineae bacterium]